MKIGLVSDVHLRSENRESAVKELSGVVDHFNDSFDPDATVVLGDVIEHAETAGQDTESTDGNVETIDRDAATTDQNAESTDRDVQAAERHEQNVREIGGQNVRTVDKQNVRAVTETLADLDSPVTYLAGNHDVMNLTSDELADLLDQELWGRIDAIDSIDGTDDTGGIDGIDALYLDSSAPHLPGARGEVSDEQLAFLDDELGRMDSSGQTDNAGETDNSDRTDSTGGTAGRLLFVHHPIHYHDVRDNYWFGETPERAFCGNKKEVNRILEARDDVLAVFNGHLHETDYTRYCGVHHFTVNAFSKERPDSGITGTYAEVTLDDRLTVRVVEGDRVTRTFEVPV